MTMKKFIGLFSAAIAATTLTVSAGVDIDIVSAYVFRGGTLNDEVSVQPGFETYIFNGAATVGTWGSFDTDASQFEEIDYYIEIPLPLGEESPVSADFLYTEYTFPGAEGDAEREIGLIFGSAVGDLGLELGLYYGVDGPISSDFYVELGAGFDLEVAENITLGLSAVLGYLSPDEGDSGFSHLTLGAGFEFVIPEIEFPVNFGLQYVVETDDSVLEVDEDVIFTIGFSL